MQEQECKSGVQWVKYDLLFDIYFLYSLIFVVQVGLSFNILMLCNNRNANQV